MWDNISITAGMIAARPWALLVIPGDDVLALRGKRWVNETA